ncbi:MAG: ATP-binding protein [Atopobiaceae bacterium]|nr:ATP-binding protein [Atopobiaceae bacterium]MCI2173658.1 ATP-binding protein [Atopobiaceae bacterium]MCI2207700.1 ATP-binding protein [Atopobiaceae bacterium]
MVAKTFYPFVDGHDADSPDVEVKGEEETLTVRYPARIAVYDDQSAAPRVVVVDPEDVRSYLEEITSTVTRLSHEQGGHIPFMVIREVVENYIHAYFIEPTVSILDGGDTIRFSDQGPGIQEKERALEFGTTSASDEMKHYIRGVGSGLPYAQNYMNDKGGTLTIEDNISKGTIVTISMEAKETEEGEEIPMASPQIPSQPPTSYQQQYQPQPWVVPGAYPVYQQMPPQIASPQYQPQTARPVLNRRESMVMTYLSTHEDVGPSELVREYGLSQPTWSKVTSHLEELGILKKVGQKKYPTQLGRSYLTPIN